MFLHFDCLLVNVLWCIKLQKISPGLLLGFWWCGILSACQRETNIYFFSFFFFNNVFENNKMLLHHCLGLLSLQVIWVQLFGWWCLWFMWVVVSCLGVADVCCGGHGQFCFSNKWAVQTDNIARVITRGGPHRSTVPAVLLASALVSICPG